MKQLLLEDARSDIAQKQRVSRFALTPAVVASGNPYNVGATVMADAVFTYPSELREQTVERNHRRSRRGIMTQECILTGRITRLTIFKVPEFGTRVSFHLEYAGRAPAICAVEGNIARDFVKHCCEGDVVVVKGFHEPRPSTAAVNTPWLGRVRVRELRIAQDVLLAA